MISDTASTPVPAARPVRLSASGALATFVFGNDVPLDRLDGEPAELWQGGEDWGVATTVVPDLLGARESALEERVAEAFAALYAEAKSRGMAVVRVWNYMPRINKGADDAETYKRFCVGRSRGVPHTPQGHPAATVIGTDAHRNALVVQALLHRQPGKPLENPRQVPAWRYPREFGPTSPGFVRGMLLGRHLLASGTASVIGHATQWPGDVAEQARECVRNLQALVAEAGGDWNASEPTLRVYVRHDEDAPAVRSAIAPLLPAATRKTVLRGDICRRDLLVEIDGVFLAD